MIKTGLGISESHRARGLQSAQPSAELGEVKPCSSSPGARDGNLRIWRKLFSEAYPGRATEEKEDFLVEFFQELSDTDKTTALGILLSFPIAAMYLRCAQTTAVPVEWEDWHRAVGSRRYDSMPKSALAEKAILEAFHRLSCRHQSRALGHLLRSGHNQLYLDSAASSSAGINLSDFSAGVVSAYQCRGGMVSRAEFNSLADGFRRLSAPDQKAALGSLERYRATAVARAPHGTPAGA